jgi:ABC-type branched-subunit amino acid transport system substrate-binding protein
MRVRQHVRLGMFAAILAVGCADGGDGASEEGVKLGFLYSTHGFFGAYEPSYVDAARLAVELINERGGTLGRPLTLVSQSLPSDPARTAPLAEAMIAGGAVAVIGPLVPPLIDRIAGIPRTTEIPFFALISDLSFDDDPYLISLLGSPAQHARFLAQRALEANTRKMAIFYDESMVQVEQTIRPYFESRGGMITSSQLVRETDDLQEVLHTALTTKPSVIAVLIQPQLTARLLNLYLRSYGGPERPFFRMWPTSCTSDFSVGVPGIGRLPHEMGSSLFRRNGPAPAAFEEAYRSRFPDTPLLGHPAFDAVFATALAISAAGTLDHARVREAISDVTMGGTPYDFRMYEEALAAIARGEDVDYDGVSHRFDLGKDGELSNPEFTLCYYDIDGKQVLSKEVYTIVE